MVYECQQCQYQTSVKCNWEKHIKTKKHQKNIKNEVINEAKMSQNEAKMSQNEAKSISNKEIDANNNIYSCNHCLKSFNRKDNLLRHLRNCKKSIIFEKSQKVSNEVDFKCKYCNINCANQSNLNRHFKTCPVLKITLNVEKEKEIKEENNKCPQVSTSVHNFKCSYCFNLYANSRSLNKHMYTCQKRLEEIKNIERENEKKIIQIEKEKEQAISQEKDKCIEIAKQTKIVNNIQNNKTINFLDQNFGSMIAMEQFLYNLEHHQKLTIDERKMLLTSFKESGLDTFYRSFNYVLKANCRRQLEEQGLKDMKLLPLYCSDGNYRSHKEKEIKGWKTKYDNKNINRMLDICNNQVFETYQELLLVAGKNLTKLYKEVKKDNNENNFDNNNFNNVLKQMIKK